VRDLVYAPDPLLFFRLAPHLDVRETANPRIFDLRTNALGLRNDEISPAKPAGTFRVLAVGDSCTFGSGAGQQQTWPARLEQRLAAQRGDLRVEVLNAGVPGWSSHQALRYLETEGLALSPDAVIFTSAVNDASPASAGGKRRFGQGRLLSDREYAEALRAQHFGVTRLLWRAGLGVGVRGSRTPPGEVKRRVPLADYIDNLRRFAAASRERGARPLLVAWPLRSQAETPPRTGELERELSRYQRAALETARAEGAAFVDLLPLVSGRPELYIDAVHMGPEGYALVAARIGAELSPALPDAP
jgi:lysophospholipase L1-like esterase